MSNSSKSYNDQVAEIAEGLDIYSKDNPRSIYNLVPETFQRAMDEIPREWIVMPERQLRLRVRPDLQTSNLRARFWQEYERAQFSGYHRMRIKNVTDGIIDTHNFIHRVLSDAEKVAWILCPPTNWLATMNTILNDSAQILYNVLHAPNLFDDDGNLNIQVFPQVMKVIQAANLIVYGAPVIRTESKNLHVSVATEKVPQTLAEVEAELKKLRASQGVPVDRLELKAPSEQDYIEVRDVDTLKKGE